MGDFIIFCGTVGGILDYQIAGLNLPLDLVS